MPVPANTFKRVVYLLARLMTFRQAVVLIYRYTYRTEVTCDAEIRRVSEDNVDDALQMEPPSRVAQFRRFLQDGDVGYYAYVEGKVAHRSWVQLGPKRVGLWYTDAQLDIGPQEAYIHYCETAIWARGRNIYPAVLSRIAADLTGSGIERIYMATTLDNIASRKGIEKAGFQEMRRINVRVLFGVPFRRDLISYV